jgi:hypothetical protein
VAGGNPARLATGLVKMTADAHHIAVHDPADGITHEARWAASGPFHAVALRHVLDLRRAAFPDANVAAAAAGWCIAAYLAGRGIRANGGNL